jgi:DNA ligase (NAD+)
MNIDGISEQTLAKFINLGWVSEYADIYELRSHILDLSRMEGFGEKSASNIMRSIDKSREVEAHRLLYALSIPLCGLDVCKRLLSTYSLDELVDESTKRGDDLFAQQAEPQEVFAHINGIGPEKSASFVRWFRDERNLTRYQRLKEKLSISTPDNSPSGDRCQGLTFVITGDVHHYKNRNELKAYIESQGGKVASAVSGSTSYLINNDVTSTSGKNKKAQQLGIPILSEDDFIAQYAPH